MSKKKIESLGPHYKTVLQALRYAIKILEDPDIPDKEKISSAKH